MIVARVRHAAAAGFILASMAGCGHKGDPVPPDHPTPPAVSAFAIERTGAEVTLRMVLPAPQPDERSSRLYDRVEVYALTKREKDPAPTPVELLASAHQVATVSPPVKEKTSADEPPAEPADVTISFKDTLAADTPVAAMVRYYAVQAARGKRRGPLSLVLRVPLDSTPAVPPDVAATYDERVLKLSWSAGQAGDRFLVDETDAAGASPTLLTPAPIEAASFETPVEFGRPRCFVVHAVQSHAGVTIVGRPAAPVCVTPVDRFPPAAPADLVAVAAEAAIDLSWTASTATDVAGYLVLRAEGANGTLQPLTPKPVEATAYQDATARSGVTYLYAVKAVDRAGNDSAISNRYTVTARSDKR
ncbi:MAG TPA: fibronectin type III domain-containing protein [Vicinamibacterales bacterium]|nr:fibronectin type III domain-containing protein [Vicinamibacterales bacterium]